MTTMELEASLYHASDNISSIMNTNDKGHHENVGVRRRKVRKTIEFLGISKYRLPFVYQLENVCNT